MTAKKIALFIDADNVSPKFGEKIFDALKSRGEIFIRRIYGNWEKGFLHGWNESILNFSLRAIQQPDFVTGKNATDMCLTIDAMDVLHDGKAETFALVSNDSDFTPLVIRLREGGMKIIGLGNGENASNAFRAACTEFIDLDAKAVEQPVEKKIPAEKISAAQMSLFDVENSAAPKVEVTPKVEVQPAPSEPPKKISGAKVVSITANKPVNKPDDNSAKVQTFHDALQKAVAACADADGFANLCSVGGYVTQEKLGFGVKSLGFGTLQKFLAAFPDRYEVRKADKNKAFLRCRNEKTSAVKPSVVKPSAEKIPADNRIDRLHKILRKMDMIHRDETGFTDLSHAGNCLGKQKIGFGIRSLGYATLQRFVADFPDRYEIRKTQKKISYRCRTNEPTTLERFDQLHDILQLTAENFAESDGFTNIIYAGDCIGKKKLSGELKTLSYKRLFKFVADCPDRYEVSLRRGGDFYYRCRANIEQNPADAKLNRLHDILHEAAENHHDAAGFSPLNYAGQQIKRKNLGFGIKDFGYGQLRQFVADFPDLYEVTHDEGSHIFRYRCKVQPAM